MHQRMRLTDVADIGRSANDRMDQTRLGVDADVSLHAEMPVVAFLRLMHLGVAGLALFLVEGGAFIKVASTMVPSRRINLRSAR